MINDNQLKRGGVLSSIIFELPSDKWLNFFCPFSHGTICKDAFLDLGKKMLEYCRTLKRIERVPTIDDLRLNFEQEFDINSNNLFNQH